MTMDAKAKKRVLIAKDVLKLLDAKKILSTRGLYLNLESVRVTDAEMPLEKILKEKKSCHVCALGSLFYAHVIRFNEVKASGVVDPYQSYVVNEGSKLSLRPNRFQIAKSLNKYFSSDQLLLIENHFEGPNFSCDSRIKKLSLRSIMNNIVENKGEFIP